MANPENKNILKIKAFNGLAQVILRSRKGESGKGDPPGHLQRSQTCPDDRNGQIRTEKTL